MRIAMSLMLVVVGAAATALGQGPPPATRHVSMRTVDLNVGESEQVTMGDGRKVLLKLVSLKETRDSLRDAVRLAEVVVEIDGKPTTLASANYRLPTTVGKVQVDC